MARDSQTPEFTTLVDLRRALLTSANEVVAKWEAEAATGLPGADAVLAKARATADRRAAELAACEDPAAALRATLASYGATFPFTLTAGAHGFNVTAPDPRHVNALAECLLQMGYIIRWSGESFTAVECAPSEYDPQIAAAHMSAADRRWAAAQAGAV